MRILHKLGLMNMVILAIVAILTPHDWYFLILTAAQLIFVPIVLSSIHETKQIVWFAIPAFLAVILIQLTPDSTWHAGFAAIYLIYTLAVAFEGVKRFLRRGFTHMEESFIDLGMMFLAVGGMWFFAYEAGIDTGFSPIMTWLTGIHFHYAGFLLPVFAGILGRLYQSKLYQWVAPALVLALVLVALGITFSTTLELISVFVYIFAIYGLIGMSFRAGYQHNVQKWLFRISFLALGISILFSLLYAYGNWSGYYTMTIDFMIKFHGLTNALLFAGIGTIAASSFTPPQRYEKPVFPVSELRGGLSIGESFLTGKKANQDSTSGLVDDMDVYNLELNTTVKDFYENTSDYRLYASVHWKTWFKPFAAIYKLISHYVQQINLPLSRKRVEMIGDVILIKPELDTRKKVRAWLRKINHHTTFVALYSEHTFSGETFMNIALPLPGSTMIGVLNLTQEQDQLILSSEKVGIFLAFREYVMKLPISERFKVWETDVGQLHAQHNMWIFGLPFLSIDYDIERK
ncbi:YndJ family protein [Piscibacillus halophilus]|uniref:YndJ family protein n=1 Tax=Piscibacillus halophilus TaxID=571933 RepID=UPI00158D4238|nr:YndJ family protein [Piscibacillus halophilus]